MNVTSPIAMTSTSIMKTTSPMTSTSPERVKTRQGLGIATFQVQEALWHSMILRRRLIQKNSKKHIFSAYDQIRPILGRSQN